jgi:hypothetical protein
LETVLFRAGNGVQFSSARWLRERRLYTVLAATARGTFASISTCDSKRDLAPIWHPLPVPYFDFSATLQLLCTSLHYSSQSASQPVSPASSWLVPGRQTDRPLHSHAKTSVSLQPSRLIISELPLQPTIGLGVHPVLNSIHNPLPSRSVAALRFDVILPSGRQLRWCANT